MKNNRTNLLPEERQKTLRREYFLRLGTVAMVFLIALVSFAAILISPTYVFLLRNAHAKNVQLMNIVLNASSTNNSLLFTQIGALSDSAKTLEGLSDVPSVSETFRAVLAVPHPGITLSGFSYTVTSNKKANKLAISGVSATRDALRNYQMALQSMSFTDSADLPVSVYAKDSNINFTITVALAPTDDWRSSMGTKTTQ